MSVIYCNNCEKPVDLDFDELHFLDDLATCRLSLPGDLQYKITTKRAYDLWSETQETLESIMKHEITQEKGD